MGLGESDLTIFMSRVFGFLGESITPLGKTTLPVLAGPINLQTEFIVIQAPSPYNAIIGRDWLHRMKVVPSTLHQKLRFPTRDRVMEVNGDQVVAKKCILTTIEQKALREVSSTKVPLQSQSPGTIEGESTIEEAPEKVQFDPSNPKLYFLFEVNLSLSNRDELVSLLVEFRNIFAWSVYKALGVSLDLTCHSLNVSSKIRPVTQKRRKLALERSGIVMEEVRQLLVADAIRTIQYPT